MGARRIANPECGPTMNSEPLLSAGAGHGAAEPGAFFLAGQPRFDNAELHRMASSSQAAAWNHAVRVHGAGAALQASGDFAVGLRAPDGRAFMAVDRFAIRSLCYRVDDGQLRFAERADELADSATGIDPQAIFDYLYFHVIPSPRTIFKGIYRLPPGHCALMQDGRLTVTRYWTPGFEEHDGRSFESLKQEFRSLLHKAVQTQLGGRDPACFLSGGTDSSTIAGMAAQASGKAVASYSIGFDAQGYDEMAFARMASTHFKTIHHEYYVTPEDLVRSIPAVAAHYDQPFGNSSAVPAYLCARMARDDGVSMLLAGDGGDELFGGNSRYARQRVFGWYRQVPQWARRALIEPLLGTRVAQAYPLGRKAASYVEQAREAMPDRLQNYNLLLRLGLPQVLTPAMAAQVDASAPLAWQREVWHSADDCSLLNRELAFDWRFTLGECDLPKVVGSAGLAGVAVGFPMLDPQLLAFSQRLPTAHKLKGLQLRWFFKEALRGFLPDAILTKKKQGFGLPFGVWVNQHAGLRAMATEALRSLADRGVVRSDFIRTVLERRLPEHPGYYGEMVWILMVLEFWLRDKAPHYRLS